MLALPSDDPYQWTQLKLPVYTYGTLVWAKFSKTWFPAMVVDGFLAKVNPPRTGNLWVYWFGDHKVSEVSRSSLDLFTNRFQERSEGRNSTKFETAVSEALKVCAERAQLEELQTHDAIREWGSLERAQLEELQTHDAIREWGSSEAGFLTLARDKPDVFAPDQDSPYPAEVFNALRKIAGLHDDNMSDSDSEPETTTIGQGPLPDLPMEGRPPVEAAGDTARSKPLEPADIEGEFCLSCASRQQVVSHHPLFEGYMCARCRDSVMETFFALDSHDGHYMFCTLCGEGGQLLMCESPECGRSYCIVCLRKYLDYTSIKRIKTTSPWACFMCTPYTLETHGLLRPRTDWQECIIRLFNLKNVEIVNLDNLVSLDVGPRRKLRVLSLFDGICTVKYVLEQLGLHIDVHYASEINETAELVTMFNHGFSVSQLGDVMKIDRNTLQEIGPIDLLVASPPCDDLDITNKEYEGFNGTGVFMFKFLLILKDLENVNDGRPVHWLLETTANLKAEYRKVLSTFLEGPPALWDAQHFSAYLCPKYYWGNLPNMYSVLEHWKKQQIFMGTIDNLLDDCLVTNLNRKAKMSKLRPVAIDARPDTRTEIDRLDPDDTVDYQLPVLMDREPSEIWVNEVEKVLGFPEHYTDVSHLSRTQRRKLLKSASSVYVLKHLLSPLNKLFATK